MVSAGDFIAGKYRVESVLGRGGMGVVVAATHLDLGELRAIKLMLAGALEDREAVERFLLEARAAARLKSPHAVTIHDVGTLETGEPYIVMPFLEGRDLRAERVIRGALPPEEAVGYVLQACEALAEAHAKGIVHRDLKPANLHLSEAPNGEPWITVLDFGIAKMRPGSLAPGEVPLTSTHAVMGTPQFMSPEQFRATREADARSDIWSLGVILYDFVTGTMPFRGAGTFEIFEQVRTARPPSPSRVRAGVPEGLSSVILHCLEKDPAMRFQSVADLTAALRPFAAKAAPIVLINEGDAATLKRDEARTQTSAGAGEASEVTVPAPRKQTVTPAETQPLATLSRASAPAIGSAPSASPETTVSLRSAPARPSRRIGWAGVGIGLVLSAGGVVFLVLRAASQPAPEGTLPGSVAPPSAPVSAAPMPSITATVPPQSAPSSGATDELPRDPSPAQPSTKHFKESGRPVTSARVAAPPPSVPPPSNAAAEAPASAAPRTGPSSAPVPSSSSNRKL